MLADAILVANRIIAEREEEIEVLRPNAVHYSDPAQLSKLFQEKQAIGTKDFRKLNELIEVMMVSIH